MDAIRFRLFSKSPDYKYVPYVILKGRTSSRLQTTTLGAPPPLILGFHPSKRHAALIASCDQGSVVLAFTLELLVLKRFFMASNASYPDVRSKDFNRFIVLSLPTIYEYHVVSVQSHFNLMLILVA